MHIAVCGAGASLWFFYLVRSKARRPRRQSGEEGQACRYVQVLLMKQTNKIFRNNFVSKFSFKSFRTEDGERHCNLGPLGSEHITPAGEKIDIS
jgi:hypothetical protein